MLDAYRLGDGRLQRTSEADASVLLCVDPDAGEREHLCRTWQLDQHALDSALDPDEVSRIEFHGERLFLIWKRPERCTGQDGMVFEVSAFGMLLEPTRLLVIAAGDSLLQGSASAAHSPPHATCCWTCCSAASTTTSATCGSSSWWPASCRPASTARWTTAT